MLLRRNKDQSNVCELELNRWFFTNCYVLKYYLVVLLEVKILSECARLILNERVKIAALYLIIIIIT